MNTMETCIFSPISASESNPRITPVMELEAIIREYESISLSMLDETKARLLNRVESKHLMTTDACREFLQRISDSYRVLEVRKTRIGRYETMYFDNNAFITYMQHHNGKGNRYKLRFRHYDSSGETYLEVKKKSNKGATEKTRMKTRWSLSGFLPEQEEFLRSAFPFDYRLFHPVLVTMYDRFTLVSMESPERITLDIGVSFGDGERIISYPGLVIAEIKYEKGLKNSPGLLALHEMGIRKRGFSKYCIGVSLLYDWLKHNRFKQNQLFLSRLFPGGFASC